MKFFEAQRLERAKHLLSSTSAPIADVSSMAGFCNPYHFSTRFRKFYGISPSEFRSKLQ
jgi:transcriptional regulator GlxA family with amidase domain